VSVFSGISFTPVGYASSFGLNETFGKFVRRLEPAEHKSRRSAKGQLIWNGSDSGLWAATGPFAHAMDEISSREN